MDRQGASTRLAAAVALTAAALVWSGPASAAGWTAVTGATSSIQEVGKVRSADGKLHVVWIRVTPGSPSTDDVLQATIAPNGAVGSPTAIASAFGVASNPAIVNTAGGGLEAFFGSIVCNNTGCSSGLFTATSGNGGATWTAPAVVLNADQAYASDMSAATLSDGTPFETWWHSTGVTVHRGLDPASPDFDYQGAMNAGCCGSQSNLAADGAGHMQLAWDSNAAGFLGVWSRAVDPTTGAPSGTPQLMPGSVTSFNGAPNHASMGGNRVPIVSPGGHSGQFFIAYPGGYPTLSKVLLWRVGSASSVTIADEPQDHPVVALAADAVGRLWVFWARETSAGGPHVFARRVGLGGLESVIDLGSPAGTSTIAALDGEVSPTGDPEALALVGLANGTSATYYSRGPQTGPPPPPQSGRAVDVSPVSGTVLVKLAGHKTFTRLTAGEQIPVGATVDTTHGRVTLVSAKSVKGGSQAADFYGGAFVVGQHRGRALTTLKLTGGNFASCARKASDRGPVAGVARRRPRRRLWGSGHGSFGTSGTSASGTVRGTIWLTEDDCEGTLIQVKRGVVTVKDLVRHKTIIVRAPHSYFAAR